MITILCRTALSISLRGAPIKVISVIRFEITPISICFWFSLRTRIPSRLGYSILGSKFLRPSKYGVDLILVLPPVGITITVSPSKSAPDNRSATLLLIPTASIALPRTRLASGCLLFTVRIGISKVPP